jgi:hypothetical protein
MNVFMFRDTENSKETNNFLFVQFSGEWYEGEIYQ